MKNSYTKKISAIGVITALSVVLVLIIHFPLLPPPLQFLEYDPADIPIYLATFIYGSGGGLIITVIVSLVQGLTVSSASGIYGIIMHILSTGAFTVTQGLVYGLFRKKNFLSVVVSLVCAIAVAVLIMIPANLVVTPFFLGYPVDAIKSLMGGIVTFNLLKQTINATVTAVIYAPVISAIKKWL